MAGYAEIRRLLEAELARRLRVVPAEVAAWSAAAAGNAAGLGLHGTQARAVADMMAVLTEGHRVRLDSLRATLDGTAFSDAYYRLLEQAGGAQDLWGIFRTIFGQRQDPRLQPLADSADLVAADCHRSCLAAARRWGVIAEDQFREPPLTYLESSLSPSTASRGQSVQTLGFPVREYRNKLLPVPIILFPLDQASSIWMMCSVAHEVGHNLDHDLGGKPGTRLSSTYKKLLIGRVPDEREPQWRRWMDEVFADAVGIVLGGAGFATAMAHWTVSLGAASHLQKLDPTAVHPPFHLRLRLLAEMLRQTLVPALATEGDALEALWQGLARPSWQAAYEADVAFVATLLLREKAIEGHALLELADDLAFAHAQCVKLAEHWLDPGRRRPDPTSFPFRWVPPAAALAAARLVAPGEGALEGLQARAADFLAAIPRPVFLGPAVSMSSRRHEFLKRLARDLDFSQPGEEKEDEL